MHERRQKYFTMALPWLIWIIACLFYCHQYVLRVSVSSLSPELAQSFHINALTLSNVTAFFFYAYFFMTIPAGILIDRFGARIMLTLAIFSCTIGCTIFAFSDDINSIEVGRLLMGGGAAFSVISAMLLARVWFSKSKFPIINGFALMIGTLGGALGGAPIAALGTDYGWKPVMLISALICLILTILAAIFVKDYKDGTKKTRVSNWREQFFNINSIVTKPQIWISVFVSGLLFSPVATFSTLWGTPFLIAEYNISPDKASLATTLAFCGFAIGCPIMGWLANRYQIPKLLTLFSGLSFATIIGIIYLPNPPYNIMLALQFLLGLFVSASCLVMVLIRLTTPKNSAAFAFSLVTMLTPAIAAIILPISGELLNINWTGTMVNSIDIYHLPNYHIALAIIPCAAFISFVLSLFVRTVKNHSDTE